ncbi:MAG: hypothetical protein KatS3mg101_0088 [Patescibacteria group bacterium]|nr:MAG: hypothetical protein KatS3mg101_0088 [Patescibacteria group bacterium]
MLKIQRATKANMNTYSVKYDELEGRLDPSAYHPTRLNAIKKIKALNCDVLPLNQVATFKRDIVTETNRDTPYFGLENIESNTGIASDVENGKDFGSAFSFKAGNILFPKLRPYLNKVHLASTEGVCSTEFHVLEANKCSNYYLFAFLSSRLVVNQTSYLMTGNTLPRLQTKDVEDLLIPILPETKQKQITDLLKKAYETREEKLKQADELLNSIDDFVRQQLGIDYQEPEEEKIYTVNSQDLENNRQDPYYHNPKFVEALASLSRLKYKVFSLGQLMVDMSGGATPRVGSNAYSDKENGIPFLRVQNITEKGILLDDVKYIKKSVHEKELKRSQLKANDLVFTITGRIGSVAVVPSNFIGNINQHSVRIQLKNEVDKREIDPTYIATFLNSSFGKLLTNRGITGGTRPALDYEYIKSIPIPIPSTEIQNTITNEFNKRTSSFEKMRAEASKVLEEAKKQVEEMILN